MYFFLKTKYLAIRGSVNDTQFYGEILKRGSICFLFPFSLQHSDLMIEALYEILMTVIHRKWNIFEINFVCEVRIVEFSSNLKKK